MMLPMQQDHLSNPLLSIEIVIASVRFFCETANHCIADTVRWEVRIFAVKQNTPQNRKVDR